jgi:hypothetical protein
MLGLAADWPAMSRLLLQVSYIWSRTGGGVDFSHNATATTNAAFFNGTLPGFITDNTTKHSLNFKGKYDFDKKFGVSFGYAYEKYRYDDDQMNGYNDRYPYYMALNATGSGTTNAAILAGFWQNPSYKAHVLWAMGDGDLQARLDRNGRKTHAGPRARRVVLERGGIKPALRVRRGGRGRGW